MVLTKRLSKLHVGSTTIIKVKHQMLIRHERLGLQLSPMQPTQISLRTVNTYPDIFESATFSVRTKKFPRPHVAYSNRIRLSTRIRWYPDSLSEKLGLHVFAAILVYWSVRDWTRFCYIIDIFSVNGQVDWDRFSEK